MKNIFAVSLALILLGATAAFSGNVKTRNSNSSVTLNVRYQVNIHLGADLPRNNSYIVQLMDQNRRVLWQEYRPGVNVYTFYEDGPVWGVKIARMVPNPYADSWAGLPNLICPADVMTGPFEIGRSYTFDLFPTFTSPDKD